METPTPQSNIATIALTALITAIVVSGVMYLVLTKDSQSDLSLAAARALVIQNWGDCADGDECEKLTVTIAQNLGNWYVTAVHEGLHDDSIYATRRTAAVFYRNNAWELGDIQEEAWQCAVGRGHQDFSIMTCY